MIDLTKSNNFIVYSTKDGNINIQILVDKENETIWLTQKKIAELFGVNIPAISKHIKNIIEDKELDISVISKMEITANDGKTYNTEHYNLDMIIAIGYRVNSIKATQFRQWTTNVLKEYMIKGFVLDDERLKQGNNIFNKNYLDELIQKIRDIRASEALFYEKIRDTFTLSYDYNPKSDEARNFFAYAQNKLEYAIVGMTSAEIIKKRANYQLPNMGLTSWSGEKKGQKITFKDITIAKNYLLQNEIEDLNLLVNMLLDYVERQTKTGKIFEMKDWLEKLDGFLEFNEYEVLQNYGSIKKSFADKFAKNEFKKYKPIQNELYSKEFNEVVKQIQTTGKLPKKNEINNKKLSTFDKNIKKAINYKGDK